jgi:hypothetical protein
MIIELTGVEPFLEDGLRFVEEDTRRIHIDLSKIRLADPLTVLGVVLVALRTAVEDGPPRVTLPTDDAEIENLSMLGLFDWLDPAWFEKSPRSRRTPPAGHCLRLCRIDREGDRRPEDFVTSCTELLDGQATGPQLPRSVGQVLAELIENAAVHARSPVGTFAVAQLYPTGEVEGPGVEVAVGDAGVGMLGTLSARYRWLTTSVEALREAFKPRVSETPPRRGVPCGAGLPLVRERVHRRISRAELVILSGNAFARLRAHERRDRYGQRDRECFLAQSQFERWGTWARLRTPLRRRSIA